MTNKEKWFALLHKRNKIRREKMIPLEREHNSIHRRLHKLYAQDLKMTARCDAILRNDATLRTETTNVRQKRVK